MIINNLNKKIFLYKEINDGGVAKVFLLRIRRRDEGGKLEEEGYVREMTQHERIQGIYKLDITDNPQNAIMRGTPDFGDITDKLTRGDRLYYSIYTGEVDLLTMTLTHVELYSV